MRFPYYRKLVSIRKNKRLVAITFSVICIVLALPWTGVINTATDTGFIGIPGGYLYSFLIGPIICLIVVSIFIGLAEDIDRHDQELENE